MMACHVVPLYGGPPTLCGEPINRLPSRDSVIEQAHPARDQRANCPQCLMVIAGVTESDEPRRDWGLGEALATIPQMQAQIDQLKQQVSILTMALVGVGQSTQAPVRVSYARLIPTCRDAYRDGKRVIPVAVPLKDSDFRFHIEVDPPPPAGEPERKSAWERIIEDDG